MIMTRRYASYGLQFTQNYRFVHNNTVKLRVEPRNCLVDDVVNISASGLQPHQPVTIATEVQEAGTKFASHAKYMADHTGGVDVSKVPALWGSYMGVQPMGLFWSMKQVSGSKPMKLMKRIVTEPWTYKLTLLEGHVDPFDTKESEIIDEIYTERYYKDPEVERVQVRHGRIRGSFFKPKGEGHFPGIIDLFGSGGGLMEYRAALLASRGFATLALAYFAYDDLPPMFDTDIEYFEEAIDWLNEQGCISKGNIGIIGLSIGGELALLTASYVNKLKAVVAISSNIYATFCSHSYKGKRHGFIEYKSELIQRDSDNNILMAPASVGKTEEARIKLENVQAPVLFIQGTHDLMAFPTLTEDLEAFRSKHGEREVSLLLYEGAGHMIDPPYTPLCDLTYHKFMLGSVLCGGEMLLHAKAQEQSWSAILQFFSKNLR